LGLPDSGRLWTAFFFSVPFEESSATFVMRFPSRTLFVRRRCTFVARALADNLAIMSQLRAVFLPAPGLATGSGSHTGDVTDPACEPQHFSPDHQQPQKARGGDGWQDGYGSEIISLRPGARCTSLG